MLIQFSILYRYLIFIFTILATSPDDNQEVQTKRDTEHRKDWGIVWGVWYSAGYDIQVKFIGRNENTASKPR